MVNVRRYAEVSQGGANSFAGTPTVRKEQCLLSAGVGCGACGGLSVVRTGPSPRGAGLGVEATFGMG